MATDWDDRAVEWDTDEAPRAYARAALSSLKDELVHRGLELSNMAVCDFGCGTGLLSEALAVTCARVDAVDQSQAMLDVLRAKVDRLGLTNVQMAQGLIGAAGEYDLIVCSSVCSFLDDYPGTVQELAALLKPNGLFVQWDWEAEPDGTGTHGLAATEIHEALIGADLESVEVKVGFTTRSGDFEMSPLMGSGQAALDPSTGG